MGDGKQNTVVLLPCEKFFCTGKINYRSLFDMLKINYGSLMLTVVYYNRYTGSQAKLSQI